MNWKSNLLTRGVSPAALAFLPHSEEALGDEMLNWTQRNVGAKRLIGLAETGQPFVLRLHAVAAFLAAVNHVRANANARLLTDSLESIQIQGAATNILASQWAAFGENNDIHPAFESLAKMGGDPFMEAIYNAIKVFGLEMTVRAGGIGLSFSTSAATGSSVQVSVDLDDGSGRINPFLFQKVFVKALIEEKGKPQGETDLVHCYKVVGADGDWDALTRKAEHAWQASIQDSRL